MVPRWDALLREAVVEATRVDQPLLPVLARPGQLEDWARQPALLPSSRPHQLREPRGTDATVSA